MAMSMSRGLTPSAVWDYLFQNIVTDRSIGEVILEEMLLFDHFEAITIADLPIAYTGTAVGGGTGAVYLNDEPSAVRLETGAVLNDAYRLDTDETASLLRFGGTRLIAEARLKINSEAQIIFWFGLINETVNMDAALIYLDTGGAAPQPNGVIRSNRAGVAAYTDLALVPTYDMTLYHTYRIELEPGVRIDVYVDNVLVGSEIVAGNVSLDEAFRVTMRCVAQAGPNKYLDVDYYKVWAE